MDKQLARTATIALIAFLCFTGFVYAVGERYEWWSSEIPITDRITGTAEWSGTTRVGYNITITVTINNPTGSDVNGHLLVEVYESDMTTVDLVLFDSDVTVLTTGWTQDFIWVANLGSHYTKATFTET